MLYRAMEGMENAALPPAAFPTPPTATTATASIKKTHTFCGRGKLMRSSVAGFDLLAARVR